MENVKDAKDKTKAPKVKVIKPKKITAVSFLLEASLKGGKDRAEVVQRAFQLSVSKGIKKNTLDYTITLENLTTLLNAITRDINGTRGEGTGWWSNYSVVEITEDTDKNVKGVFKFVPKVKIQ